ncbi:MULTISPECIES: ArsR/SmtB family transcription factor [Jonquetella]|uniref:Putative transcriptional regulator n=1 Tax=Jonquetella anthropi DSM 22815 TaxID=885272 RepID=H0UIT2_9BACT|nr:MULTISPECIES: metalloregulator ArsR/SmtB family transcription factor [Jonquetella]EEX48955.1 transcriptional regulator, ArsR family [Jonquetella anthropi E3_33 E1]EHM12726.1 putative transcriptional regulator [Jonquetella anthropi DSM 22815]ERL23463.1 sugar-specific transcriptional regulator, TrmB family [Jonquetella sp. BV3C21]
MKAETSPVDLFPEKRLDDLADLYRMFADTTRVRLLYLLSQGELSVNELAHRLSMSQSAVSHQLRQLRIAKLVRTRREGRTIYYSLADSHVEALLHVGLEHVSEP